jgi:cyanophycin synthetase
MGARAVLTNPDLDMAVLETARGGILLRGLGYDANDASVLTNVSADHLDLQGLHTLPELVEVKSVICRVTRPSGVVVLNADDELVAAVSRRVKAPVYFFSLLPRSSRVRAHLGRGGTAFVLDDGWLVELSGPRRRRIVAAADVPATLGGLARHNVANALAAIAGARALRIPYAAIAGGLRDFRNSSDLMPGRLNLYRNGHRLVIVDYAHNEAGLRALLDTAEGLIGERGRRRATLTTIVGAAGDRPDDALRAVGRLAAQRADEVALKEDLPFLRGRTRESAIGELRDGVRSGGMNPALLPVYELELQGLIGELTTPGRMAATDDGTPRVVMLMCHAERVEVGEYLRREGFVEVEDPAELGAFRP